MTERFDPRSPLPETPDHAGRVPADDPDDDSARDPRRDDPGAWENYLPGGSMHVPGDIPPEDAPRDDHPNDDPPDYAPDADDTDDDPYDDGLDDDDLDDDNTDDDDTEGPSSGADRLDAEALDALMEAYSPRALLARLPPLPTLASSAGGKRPRRREWSPARRVAFLQMLSASQSVVAAARSVGMSRSGVYNLRGRIPESAFVRAWNKAFSHGYDALAHAALNRALNGVEVPHYYKGELVGTSRRYDERLTLGLLSKRGEIVHGATGYASPEDGEWELLLHAVVEEAEEEIEALAARAEKREESEA